MVERFIGLIQLAVPVKAIPVRLLRILMIDLERHVRNLQPLE